MVTLKLAATLALATATIVAVGHAFAQVLSPEEQLPGWAQRKWQELAKARMLKVSTRINPFVWRGDFDGDGRPDVALLVQHTPSRKEGIAILPRRNAPPYVLGAGTPFGNGGDDFVWIDFWNVEDRGTLQRSYSEKRVRLRAEGLLVAKEGSASALIYIENGKARWRQQGD